MISFRKATMADVDAVTELLVQTQDDFRARNINMWQKGYPTRDNIVADVNQNEAYIAEVDGAFGGYMYIQYGPEEFQSTLRGTWRDDNCTVMHRLLTAPTFRRIGLGTAMMKFWEQKTVESGRTSMRTETDETNLPMRALMKHCGFIEPGLLTFDNSDKVAFEKLIR